MVHISTVFIVGIAALLVGLFAGSFFFSGSDIPQRQAQAPVQQAQTASSSQAPPAQQGVSRETLDHIAQHERNVAVDPKNVDEWVTLGNLYYDAHDPAKAVQAYERALELKPDMPDVLTDMGTMYRSMGQPAEALAAYERAIALRPAHTNAWFNKGVVLRDLQREDDAYAAWREVVRINPQATVPGSGGRLLRTVLEQANAL